MAPRLRSHSLETRTQRLKLPIAKKPIFVRIGNGLSLGYRRNRTVGTWVMRVSDGKGGNWTTAVGSADDREEADGHEILTFWQAQDRARAEARSSSGISKKAPLTVRDVAETHLQMLAARNPRSAHSTRGRLETKFLAQFGDRTVLSLTKTQLDGWLASMVSKSEDPETVRRSKDSANRVLSMVKALLNHAVRDPANGIKDDSPWRLVKPFHGVAKPRDIRYTPDEIRRLISSAPDQATSNLIKGAYLTGARFGELAQALVRDFDPKAKTLWINSGKTGSRSIILQTDAAQYISSLCEDRDGADFLFVKADGTRWKRSEQTRPFKEALKRADLPTDGSIYALRHSYISSAIEGGVPLNIIAENCGTSVRMIETTYAKVLAEHRRNFIERGAPRL
jgi:integrase